MAHRVKRKEIFRTGPHAVATGRAALLVNHRQPVRVHRDGIKIADGLAIPQPEAAPKTCLAPSGHQGRPGAGLLTLVVGPLAGDVGAPRTGEAGHQSFFLANPDPEVGRYPVSLGGRGDCALSGQNLARHQGFRKWPATGIATSSTVGVRKHRLHRVDPRVLFHLQPVVGQDQARGQDQGQSTNHGHRRQYEREVHGDSRRVSPIY